MSRPLNSHELALEMDGYGNEIDRLVDELIDAERQAIIAREDYNWSNEKAFVAADGAMDLRKRVAELETYEARLAAKLAEAHVHGLREKIRSLYSRIDVCRSKSSALKAEVNLGERGQP